MGHWEGHCWERHKNFQWIWFEEKSKIEKLVRTTLTFLFQFQFPLVTTLTCNYSIPTSTFALLLFDLMDPLNPPNIKKIMDELAQVKALILKLESQIQTAHIAIEPDLEEEFITVPPTDEPTHVPFNTRYFKVMCSIVLFLTFIHRERLMNLPKMLMLQIKRDQLCWETWTTTMLLSIKRNHLLCPLQNWSYPMCLVTKSSWLIPLMTSKERVWWIWLLGLSLLKRNIILDQRVNTKGISIISVLILSSFIKVHQAHLHQLN